MNPMLHKLLEARKTHPKLSPQEVLALHREDQTKLVENVASHIVPQMALGHLKRYHEDAVYDDLIQAAMIGIWEAVIAFDPRKEVEVYTFAAELARREVYDTLKAENRHCDLVSLEEILEEGEEHYEDALSDIAYGEEQGAAERAMEFEYDFGQVLKRLTPEEQTIMLMLKEGYSQAEIAQEMKTSQSTIFRRIKEIEKKVLNL